MLALEEAHRPGSACCASLDGKAEPRGACGAAAGPRRFHPLLVLYGKKQKLTYARLQRLLVPHEVELPGVSAPPPTYFPRLARVTPGGAKGGARKGLILHGLSIPDQAAGFVVEPSPQTSPDFLAEVVETLAAELGGAFSRDATLSGAKARAEWRAWVEGKPRFKPKSEQARVEVLYELRERVGRLTGRRSRPSDAGPRRRRCCRRW